MSRPNETPDARSDGGTNGDGVGGDGTADDGTADEQSDDGLLSGVRRAHLVRLGHVLGILLLIAIAVPFVLYTVPQLIGAEYSYVVLSGSMEPALHPADVTFVDEVDPEAVRAEDVINFMESGDSTTTTHRVIEVVERDGEVAFRTKGDNNPEPDQGVVTVQEFRGRVMTVGGVPVAFPLIGRLIQFTSTGVGFALLFGVPVSLLVVNEVWNVVSAARSTGDGTDSADADAGDDADGPPATPAGATDGSAAGDDGESGGLTFRPAELKLGVAVLGVFVAYSGWVAASDPGTVTIGVTGSAAVAFLMLAGLYALGTAGGESQGSPPAAATADPDALVVHPGSIPRDGDLDRESVASLEGLIDLAETADGQLRRDPDEGTFHLRAEDALYVYAPDPAAVDGLDGAGGAGADGTDGTGDEREDGADAGEDGASERDATVGGNR